MSLFKSTLTILSYFLTLTAIHAQHELVLYTQLDTVKQIGHLQTLAAEQLKQYPSLARSYSQKALHLAKASNSSKEMAQALSQIGISYRVQALYKPAFDHLLKAYKIYEELGDEKAITKTHNEIGMIYWQQKDLQKAMKHHEAALELATKLDNKQEMAIAYKNLGVVHFYKRKYEQALIFYQEALTLVQQANLTKLIPTLYNNIGIAHAKTKNYETALNYYQKALSTNEGLNDMQLDAAIYDNLGDIYRYLNQFGKAKMYLEKGLEKATEVQAINRMIESEESLYQLYQQQRNYQQALQHFQAQMALRDSFINSNNSRQIAELIADYESRKKDKNIELLKKSEELLKQQKKFDNLLQLTLIALVATIVILAAFALNWQRTKLWKRRQLIERQQEEHEAREALVQASLENEQLAKKVLEREMDYKNQQISSHTLHIIQKQEFLESMRQELQQISKKPTSAQLKKLIKQIDHRQNLNKEWEQISENLEQVNASFYTQLQERCPALTPNELRLCLLAKLNFSIKDMAMLLKIAPNSVAIARHRIRKKLNLAHEENLSKFMMNIS